MLEQVAATRFVTPLREGGSLPGLIEADDLGIYVTKFRGAGQGVKVLVAEVVVAELARRLGFRVPELKVIDLDAVIARFEPDEEVQDLLTASVGLNLGLDFLPGAFGWDCTTNVTAAEAARILWLDAFTANVDRSWRNPNLLVWHGDVWLIDHGAALYFHHSWPDGYALPGASALPGGRGMTPERFAAQPYDARDHVMSQLCSPSDLLDAHDEMSAGLSTHVLAEVLSQVPDAWLQFDSRPSDPSSVRTTYSTYLQARLASVEHWLPRVTRDSP